MTDELVADVEKVHRFFWYWYEWMASPSRRRQLESVSGLPRSASLLLWKILFLGPLGVTDLARAMGLEKSTVSRQLEPLRARDLVAESAGGRNRRTSEISITPAGRAVCARVDALQLDYWSAVLSHLPPPDRRRLTASLDSLQHAMDAEADPDPDPDPGAAVRPGR